MLAERYLNRRFAEGKEEGKTEGRIEGEIKGKTEGKQEAFKAARAWYISQQEALAKGEKFTEPPPWEKPQ